MPFIKVYVDDIYCGRCPYTAGVCGCRKYLTEEGYNTVTGVDKKGEQLRSEICKRENK